MIVAGIGAAWVSTLSLVWSSRDWPLVHDAPLMHYVAARLLEGAVPYRDVFDMNFPGVYLAHVAGLLLLGGSDVAFRVFDLLWLAAVMIGLWVALQSFGPWAGAAAAGLFALYHVAGGPWLAGQRDFLLCVPLAWMTAGALRHLQTDRVPPLGLAALSLGVGIWVKPHAVLLVPLLGWLAWRHATRARALAVVAAGVLMPGVGAVAWLAAVGALPTFVDIVTGYLLPLYSRLGREPLPTLLGRIGRSGAVLALVVWGVLGATIVANRGRRDARFAVLGAGVTYGIVHFLAQGRGWEYHLYPFTLFTIGLGAAGLGVVLATGRRVPAVVWGVALAVTVGIVTAKGWQDLHPQWIAETQARVRDVVGALRPVVVRGGVVQVLDTTEGGIDALNRLGARQPTRFLYDFHFYHDVETPYVGRLRAEFLAGLAARPPAAVVLFERGWPTGRYDRLEGFPELRQWLERAYRLAAQGDGYRLYLPDPVPGGMARP